MDSSYSYGTKSLHKVRQMTTIVVGTRETGLKVGVVAEKWPRRECKDAEAQRTQKECVSNSISSSLYFRWLSVANNN